MIRRTVEVQRGGVCYEHLLGGGDQVLSLFCYREAGVQEPWQVDDGTVEIDAAEAYRLTLRGWWAADQGGEAG